MQCGSNVGRSTKAWWVQVVAHIAKRVAGMHRGGYVHRDLKPSNIMWLPGYSQ